MSLRFQNVLLRGTKCFQSLKNPRLHDNWPTKMKTLEVGTIAMAGGTRTEVTDYEHGYLINVL